MDDYNIFDIADTYKKLLRSREKSLLPHEIYYQFDTMLRFSGGYGRESSNQESTKIEILAQLCQLLPSKNKQILGRLLQILWQFNNHSAQNKMTAANLRQDI